MTRDRRFLLALGLAGAGTAAWLALGSLPGRDPARGLAPLQGIADEDSGPEIDRTPGEPGRTPTDSARESEPGAGSSSESGFSDEEIRELLRNGKAAALATTSARFSRSEISEDVRLAIHLSAARFLLIENHPVATQQVHLDKLSGLAGLDDLWARKKLDLSAHDREAIEKLIETQRARIADAVTVALAEVDALAAAQWDRGEILIRHMSEPPSPARAPEPGNPGLFRYSCTIGADNHEITFRFDSKNYPALDARFQEIERLKAEAAGVIDGYLEAHGISR